MGQRLASILAWFCGFSCVICSSGALAEPLDEGYFAPKLMLGVGGKVEVEASVAGFNGSVDDDLELSYGGGLQYVHPLHEYFALGGLVGLRSWTSDDWDDANLDRNLLLDIAIMPEGRLPLNRDVELYLAVPIGLALDFWGEDGINAGAGGTTVVATDVNTGVGFGVAFLLGGRFVLADGFGLFAELGYQLHSFTHEGHVMVIGIDADQDFDYDLGQVAINAGVFLF